MKLYRSRLALAVLAAALTSGCTTMGAWDSQEAIALAPSDSLIMANDVAHVLGVEYPPGQTTFAMASDGRFGSALENKLRGAGFAVSTLSESRPAYAKELAYVLDELGQPGTYRLGVRVSPAYRLDLLYRIDSAGQLQRGSGVTVRNGSSAAHLPPIERPVMPIEAAFVSDVPTTPVSNPIEPVAPFETAPLENNDASPELNWIVQDNGTAQSEQNPEVMANAAAAAMDVGLSEQIASDGQEPKTPGVSSNDPTPENIQPAELVAEMEPPEPEIETAFWEEARLTPKRYAPEKAPVTGTAVASAYESEPASIETPFIEDVTPADTTPTIALSDITVVSEEEPEYAPPMPVHVEFWDLQPGPLRQQLLSWGEDSDWSITWKGNQDLIVEVGHTFHGPVDEAVIQVVTAFSRAGADIRLDHIAGNRQMIVRTGR